MRRNVVKRENVPLSFFLVKVKPIRNLFPIRGGGRSGEQSETAIWLHVLISRDHGSNLYKNLLFDFSILS